MKLISILSSGTCLLSLAAAITPAFAQMPDQATAEEEANAAQGDIVVTASRRESTASKVPLSLSAMSQEQMDTKTIRSLEDVARVTPGVTFSRGFGNATTIAIRGISGSGAGTTGIYIDDTPIQVRSLNVAAYNVYPLIFDLERVEVLRGPQGTLFGAGSQGGTVRFITPEPSLSGTKIYGRAEVNTIDGGSVGYEAGIAYSTAAIEDKIGLRVSAWLQHGGGYIDKVSPYTNEVKATNINQSDSRVFRIAATLKPTERLSITPSFYYQDQKFGDNGQYWLQYSNPDNKKFNSGITTDQPSTDRFMLSSLKVTYEADGFTVTSNTSQFARRETSQYDYSTLIPAQFVGQHFFPEFPNYPAYALFLQKQKVFTQELRIQSANDSPFSWLIGGFYQNARQTAVEDIVDSQFTNMIRTYFNQTVEEYSGQSLIPARLTNGDDILFQDDLAVDRQLAAFGELSYRLFDQLTFTAGARIAQVSTSLKSFATGPFNAGTVSVDGKIEETPFTPKFAISWQANNDLLIYGSAAKGFRNGGVNRLIPYDPTATSGRIFTCTDDQNRNGGPVPGNYKSDSLWSYELGSKLSLFNRRLTLDGSVYLIKWKNIQQSRGACGVSYLDNSGNAESRGFDLAVSARPFRGVSIGGALAYTDAAYTTQISTTNNGRVSITVAEGDAIATKPWTITLHGQYEVQLAGKDIYIRGDYERRSGYARPTNLNPITAGYNVQNIIPPSWSFITMRAGMKVDGWDFSLFVKNLTNASPSIYYRFDRRGVLGLNKARTIDPRTIGVTATMRY
jgi:iron complex outermembrane receptor protein